MGAPSRNNHAFAGKRNSEHAQYTASCACKQLSADLSVRLNKTAILFLFFCCESSAPRSLLLDFLAESPHVERLSSLCYSFDISRMASTDNPSATSLTTQPTQATGKQKQRKRFRQVYEDC